jgi:TnpA family transposase
VHFRLRHQHRAPRDRGRRTWPHRGGPALRPAPVLSAEGRSFAAAIADATFAARKELIWGTGTGAVASDSTHFGAFDQNLFTQYHVRYGGRGVLIYWHVDKKSVAINTQLISCTASEVAAMVEGAMHHRTEMDVEANCVDSHGQSEIGFGITRLLGFELKPRFETNQPHQALRARR